MPKTGELWFPMKGPTANVPAERRLVGDVWNDRVFFDTARGKTACTPAEWQAWVQATSAECMG